MNARTILAFALVLLLFGHEGDARQASEPGTGFVTRTYRSGGMVMPYRLFIPRNYDAGRAYPLVLWLHGAGGFGNDNLRQISGDQVPGTRLWIAPETQDRHPAFVLAPQANAAWSSGPNPPNTLVLAILDALVREFSIDRRRVYVVGQSAGGEGAWALIMMAPDRFAAALLVCPGLYPHVTGAEKASALPIWVFAGEADMPVVARSRDLVAALRAAAGTPLYSEYPGAGHEIWTQVFSNPEIVGWLFSHSR